MDPIAVAAGTALVGAIATDMLQQVKQAVAGLWQRVRPGEADSIGDELDALREDILRARQVGDTDTERDLEGTWRVKLQRLLRADPALGDELQRVLDQVLSPTLTAAEQARVQTIISGTASNHARLNQAGRDVNLVTGDQYTAGRDQHIQRP